MNTIYLVRHAESIANTQGIYQGQTYDTELSPIGRRQARALARRCTSLGIRTVITSPLKRTSTTARYVTDHIGAELVTVPELIETNHGQWEGRQKTEIMAEWPDLYRQWLVSPSAVRFPDGEAFPETTARVLSWWRKAEFSGPTLIVTHDNIIRIIVADILRTFSDSLWNFHLMPTAITSVERNSAGSKIISLNDTHHLRRFMVDIGTHAL